MSVFRDLAGEWSGEDEVRRETCARLGSRPVPQLPVSLSPLDSGMTVVDCFGPVDYKRLFRDWPDRQTAADLAEAVHDLEMERAAQAPKVTLSVAIPPVAAAPETPKEEQHSALTEFLTAPVCAVPPEPAPAPARRGFVATTVQLRRRLGLILR